MQICDFAFINQGKVIRPLEQQEAHYLLPIDKVITPHHDHALLLLHGFASSPAVYRAMLPHIHGYDRIVCPVLPGHADSIQAFSQSTAQDWRDTAYHHCAKLVDHYTQVSIAGLSLGGLLALELSSTFQIYHLYLLAPALKLRCAKMSYLAARLLRSMGCKTVTNHGGNFFSDQYQELTYRRLPISAIVEVLSFIQSQKYRQPNCSTHLFLGRYDKIVDSQSIAKQYTNQLQVQIHWLEHSAHVLPLDGDIDLLLHHIR